MTSPAHDHQESRSASSWPPRLQGAPPFSGDAVGTMIGRSRVLWACAVLVQVCTAAMPGETGVGAGPLAGQARDANSLLQAGPCSMLSNLQDAVVQVLAAHYEYGRGIHRLHGVVRHLQADLGDLKQQLGHVEQRAQAGAQQARTRGKQAQLGEQHAWTGEQQARSKGQQARSGGQQARAGKQQTQSGEQQARSKGQHARAGEQHDLSGAHHARSVEQHAQSGEQKNRSKEQSGGQETWSGAQRHGKSSSLPIHHKPHRSRHHHGAEPVASGRHPVLDYTPLLEALAGFMGGYLSSSASSQQNFTALMHNVTAQITQHDRRLGALNRKMHSVRRQAKQAASSMGAWQKTLKLYDARMLSHMLEKQGQINTALEQRVTALEESVKQQGALLQRDDPRDHQTGTSDGRCPANFVRHASSCYLFVNETAHWVDAEKHCLGRHANAHLVAIETKGEHDFIVMYRQYNAARWSSYYVWTGGTNMLGGGEWRWVSTQRPLTYTRWRAGKPTTRRRTEQHCLYLPTEGGASQWDEWHCYAARLNYVCEVHV